MTFNYENGKTVEFKELNINNNHRVYAGQPAKIAGERTSAVPVYVTKKLYDFDGEFRYQYGVPGKDNTRFWDVCNEIQVGVLANSLKIGLPTGVYVPLKWNHPARRFELFLDGLINDKLIPHEAVIPKEVFDKINKKEEDDEVGEAVA